MDDKDDSATWNAQSPETDDTELSNSNKDSANEFQENEALNDFEDSKSDKASPIKSTNIQSDNDSENNDWKKLTKEDLRKLAKMLGLKNLKCYSNKRGRNVLIGYD